MSSSYFVSLLLVDKVLLGTGILVLDHNVGYLF